MTTVQETPDTLPLTLNSLPHPSLTPEQVALVYQVAPRLLGRPLRPYDPAPCCPHSVLFPWTDEPIMACDRCGHLSPIPQAVA